MRFGLAPRPWALVAALPLAVGGCTTLGAGGDGGVDGTASSIEVPSDASRSDATSAAGVTPGHAPSALDAAVSEAALAPEATTPDPSTSDAEPPDSGDAAPATGVVPGPDWANWPMPNPPSSDFPNPASYDTTVPGVVVDNVTGLTWQQTDVASSASSIAEAARYCEALTLAGYDDWRLPSRIEIWSIEDFMRTGVALDPAFTTIGTSNAAAVPWTRTPNFGGYTYGGVVFGSGDGGPAGSMSVDPVSGRFAEANGAIRCVRGSTAQPATHFTSQNGTVFDNGTKLTWQQSFDPAPSLPDQVASYCASLTLAGGGWRGPSVKELETIVDDTRVAPSLDTTVFLVPSGATTDSADLIFYTATPWETGLDAGGTQPETLYVDFVNGSNGTGVSVLPIPPLGTNNLFQVRCVK